jgi:hypothetical protein
VPAGSAPKRTEEEEARHAVSKMSRQQKAELLRALETLEGGGQLPETPAGRVVNTLSFQQREVVLTVLRREASNA